MERELKNHFSETRIDVDLKAVAHNIAELRRLTQPTARLMAVVKANGYGHGALQVAQSALASGADMLGVARIREGIELRKAGLDAEILVLGHTPPEQTHQLIGHDLVQTVFSSDWAKAYAAAAAQAGAPLKVHLKIDTGMGRLGIPAGDLTQIKPTDLHACISEILSILNLPSLDCRGIFTHFALADSRVKTDTMIQFNRFLDVLDGLRKQGIEFPLKHAANSAAIMELPETHLDMVRAGIAMYGLYPSQEVDRSQADLRPALRLTSKVIQVKSVPEGFKVSYGGTYIAPRPTVIATVPIGYGDGFNRNLSSKGEMLVHGKRARIAGRVCMDLTMLDVGHIADVRPGDEVVIIGNHGNDRIEADDIAGHLNTINYEVVTALTNRIPRYYQW